MLQTVTSSDVNRSSAEPAIKLEGIGKIYRTDEIETEALENVNLSISKGEFVSIMGPSGCGKSTLLNIMGLLDRPSSGTIRIDGKSPENMSDRQLSAFRSEKIGFVFQNFHLIKSLDVGGNVEIPILYRSMNALQRSERVKEVLTRVDLLHRIHHFPSQLSGGQCQRVAIARAIAGDPEIILADEPTGNFDSENSKEIIALLRRFNREFNQTVVIITHDERIALSADRVISVQDGKIVRDEVRVP